MDDPQLPGMLGPFGRFNIHAEYWWRSGWVLELRHRHDGEALNCPHVVKLEGLTSGELLQYVEDYIETGMGRFDWEADEDRCCPHGSR